MKYAFSQFKDRLPSLTWDKQTLADKLSLIGHETEIYGETLDVTLTSNRKDCKDLAYLLFDLAGVYNLEMTEPPNGFSHGPEIVVTAEKINKLLGSNIDQPKLKELERLGFVVSETGVQPPEFRDVLTVADVAEEVVRIVGYDALKIDRLSAEPARESAEFSRLQSIKFALVNAGWTETAANSFSREGKVELKNPFTETEAFLRPTLLNGLLQTLAKNPFMKRAKFFEVGDVFETSETTKLGLISSGYKDSALLTEELNQIFGQPITFTGIDASEAAKFEAKQGSIMFAEIDTSTLKPKVVEPPVSIKQPLPEFKTISKFPPLIRDINDPIFREVSITSSDKWLQETEKIITDYREVFPELFSIELIDEYRDPDSGRVTKTFRLTFQNNQGHTFTQEEVKDLDTRITNHFFQRQ